MHLTRILMAAVLMVAVPFTMASYYKAATSVAGPISGSGCTPAGTVGAVVLQSTDTDCTSNNTINVAGSAATVTGKLTVTAADNEDALEINGIVDIDNGNLQVDNLQLSANTIASTDTNGDISITPHGDGNVGILTDTLNFTDGNITIATTASDGDIILAPHGDGDINLKTDSIVLGEADDTPASFRADGIVQFIIDNDSDGTDFFQVREGSSANYLMTLSDTGEFHLQVPNADNDAGNGIVMSPAGVLSQQAGGHIVADQVTVGTTTATTTYPALFNSASGDLSPKLDGGLTYNAATNTLTATTFAGTVTTNANLDGDITSVGNTTAIATGVIVNADIKSDAAIDYTKLGGTVTTWNQDTTGTAATVTAGSQPAITGVGIITAGEWKSTTAPVGIAYGGTGFTKAHILMVECAGTDDSTAITTAITAAAAGTNNTGNVLLTGASCKFSNVEMKSNVGISCATGTTLTPFNSTDAMLTSDLAINNWSVSECVFDMAATHVSAVDVSDTSNKPYDWRVTGNTAHWDIGSSEERGTEDFGYFKLSCGGTTAPGCLFKDNLIYGSDVLAKDDIGLWITAADPTGTGYELTGASLTVSSNMFNDIGQEGVKVSGATVMNFIGNTIRVNDADGFIFNDTVALLNSQFSQNIMSSTNGATVFLTGSNNQIVGNTFSAGVRLKATGTSYNFVGNYTAGAGLIFGKAGSTNAHLSVVGNVMTGDNGLGAVATIYNPTDLVFSSNRVLANESSSSHPIALDIVCDYPKASQSSIDGIALDSLSSLAITGNTFNAHGTSAIEFSYGGYVGPVTIITGGSGITSATVVFDDPPSGGTTALGTVTITGGVVTGIVITDRGSGYTSGAPTVTITTNTSAATGTAVLADCPVENVTITGNTIGENKWYAPTWYELDNCITTDTNARLDFSHMSITGNGFNCEDSGFDVVDANNHDTFRGDYKDVMVCNNVTRMDTLVQNCPSLPQVAPQKINAATDTLLTPFVPLTRIRVVGDRSLNSLDAYLVAGEDEQVITIKNNSSSDDLTLGAVGCVDAVGWNQTCTAGTCANNPAFACTVDSDCNVNFLICGAAGAPEAVASGAVITGESGDSSCTDTCTVVWYGVSMIATGFHCTIEANEGLTFQYDTAINSGAGAWVLDSCVSS